MFMSHYVILLHYFGYFIDEKHMMNKLAYKLQATLEIYVHVNKFNI